MIGSGFNSVMILVDVAGKKLEDIEKEVIQENLKYMNKSKAAKSLGIDRRTLYRKIAKYGIK